MTAGALVTSSYLGDLRTKFEHLLMFGKLCMLNYKVLGAAGWS